MKRWKSVMLGAVLSIMMSATAFAGQWVQDGTGWWYDNGDGTWPASTWQWIDGDGDGVAECYYFDESGYMLANTTVVGGEVNENGEFMFEGIVQTRQVAYTVADSDSVYHSNDDQTIIFHWSTDPMTVEILGCGEEGWFDLTYDLYWIEEGALAREYDYNNVGASLGWTDFVFDKEDTMQVLTYGSDGSYCGSFQDGEYDLIQSGEADSE